MLFLFYFSSFLSMEIYFFKWLIDFENKTSCFYQFKKKLKNLVKIFFNLTEIKQPSEFLKISFPIHLIPFLGFSHRPEILFISPNLMWN